MPTDSVPLFLFSRFEFFAMNHTLSQSSFEDPCTKQTNNFGQQTGIDSAFNFATQSTDGKHQPTFAFSVEDDKTPLWFYCRQTVPVSHCNDGMVVSRFQPLKLGYQHLLMELYLSNSLRSTLRPRATRSRRSRRRPRRSARRARARARSMAARSTSTTSTSTARRTTRTTRRSTRVVTAPERAEGRSARLGLSSWWRWRQTGRPAWWLPLFRL